MSENDLIEYINSSEETPIEIQEPILQQVHLPQPQIQSQQDYNFPLFTLISETVIGVVKDILNAEFDDLLTKQNRKKGLIALLFAVFFVVLVFKAFHTEPMPNKSFIV